MPGPGLSLQALGGVKVAGAGQGTNYGASSNDAATAAYGSGATPSDSGSGLAALSPLTGPGLAVSAGVVSVVLLVLIYHSLPK